MLPPHAPEIYLDRATLWNAVESCEKHPKAQLAYSFDIAMQNELTLEENMELARKFVQEQFVTKGMIADLAFHSPEKEDGGIPNPHFHVMTTMRPLNPDGTWGQKQRREYLLDEDGNRIRDKNGDYMFNAVHTTDWHEPETLEHWREQWAAAVNTKFEEKGLDVRIDHRSYAVSYTHLQLRSLLFLRRVSFPVAGLEQAFQQLVLVFLCQHRPVLQSCKHIGIQYIIADIVHGTLA